MHDYNASLDFIYIQSHHFDSETYLRAVHANTSIAEFKQSLNYLKEQMKYTGQENTKIQLVIDNYNSFLDAKRVLDTIQRKLVESEST